MFRKIKGSGRGAGTAIVTVDGESVQADEGEPVAAVLLRLNPLKSRETPLSGAPLAPYCMMGVCFECLVEIDGATSTRGCMVFVSDGMAVRRQIRRPDPASERAA